MRRVKPTWAFVRSPHALADVVAIDTAAARGVAGVRGVFTGRDLVADGVGTIPTLIAERGGGIRNRDGSPFAEAPWYPLATDRVRHSARRGKLRGGGGHPSAAPVTVTELPFSETARPRNQWHRSVT